MSNTSMDALKLLEAGITKLIESGEWTRYLKTQAAFHNYSFGNTLLIASQCPEASRVAGFKTWQKLGRHVRKGEKAIKILAPRPYTVTDEEGKERDKVAFASVSVFDISQTDGEDLPTVANKLTGDDKGLIAKLAAFSNNRGVKVAITATSEGMNGFYSPEKDSITVSDALEPAQQAKTLAHEIAHSFLHRDLEVYRAHRPDSELEAESVAFVVLNHFGIDSGDYSFGYVASWRGADNAVSTLKACATRIQATAKAIIDGIENKKEHESD